ncbi:tripartite tricarboxylate transporter TctB family protein [Amorphus sp. 3PC139-8]|uniref:tripartite tricarboxylate transporter TctB family protein n=1 Tax=Amorphus sp. 3PC139-8 TaxID=2735676 RepID=UPI00345CF865
MTFAGLGKNAAAMVFLAIAAVVAGLGLYALASVASSPYEPLGTAAFPRAVAIITLALVLMKSLALVRSAVSHEEEPETRRLHLGPAKMLGLAVLYLLALSRTEIDFRIVTSLFLFVATWTMVGRLSARALVVLLAFAIATSVGLDLLFKHFLYVDL